jgi:alpha-mannosidase
MIAMSLQIFATPYFRHVEGRLRRALKIQLPETWSGPVECRLAADGQEQFLAGEARDGWVWLCGLEVFDRPVEVRVGVKAGAQEWTGEVLVSPARPWTIYIAQDKHLDYGWIHPVEQVVERINNLTDFALERLPRWNFDVSIWVEEYLRARPAERGEKLLAKLRSGDFETAAAWLVPSPAILGVEEMVHSLRYAHSLQAQGVAVNTAMLQEAPSLAWGMVAVLAGAGIPYAVKGAYNLRNPHLAERDPYPLAWWEAPDGSRVLLRWDTYTDTGKWGGYGEAYELWRSPSLEERATYIEQTAERYEAYPAYPFSAILLAGSGFDLFPQTTAVRDFIAWFNAQGWEYPRLVDATWADFWQHIESEIEPQKLPVVRGDWGAAWEEWPAQLARAHIVYRRARETVLSAQTLSAWVGSLDPNGAPARRVALDLAWRGLLQYSEHDFGGISADLAEDEYETKSTYAHTALREGTRAQEGSLAVLADLVPARPDDGQMLLVTNPNSWTRGGVVEVVVQDTTACAVIDLASGASLPCQIETRGPGWQQHYLSFYAADIAGFGYRTYLLRKDGPAAPPVLPAYYSAQSQSQSAQPLLENPFYRLTVDPQTGGLASLIDHQTGRELVEPSTGAALNAYLHISEGVLHRSKLVSIQGRAGALSSELIIETTCLRARVRTTYRLFHEIKRLDITNELYKEASSEPQASWFAFPIGGGGAVYHTDGAAVIVRAGTKAQGGDLLPGSALSSSAVQSFLAASSPAGTVVLATPDAYLFQFGAQILENPMGDSDPAQPLALSLALHNYTRNDFIVRQSGQEYFVFRYSLFSTAEAFQPSQAVRFAREIAQPLPRAWVTGGAGAPLPVSASFATLQPANVIATALAPAEDGQGWVLRLWECDGKDTLTSIQLGRLGARQAWVCDLLEKKLSPLAIEHGEVCLRIPARGLKAVRFEE